MMHSLKTAYRAFGTFMVIVTFPVMVIFWAVIELYDVARGRDGGDWAGS